MQCSQTLSVISSTDWEKNHWSDETSPAFWVWARFAGSIFILPNTARSWYSAHFRYLSTIPYSCSSIISWRIARIFPPLDYQKHSRRRGHCTYPFSYCSRTLVKNWLFQKPDFLATFSRMLKNATSGWAGEYGRSGGGCGKVAGRKAGEWRGGSGKLKLIIKLVFSGQIGSGTIGGLEKDINRYRFLTFFISKFWIFEKASKPLLTKINLTSCLFGSRFVLNPFFLSWLAHFYLMEKSAKVLHYFGLDCGMLEFLQIFFSQAVTQRIVDSPGFLETGLVEKNSVCAHTTGVPNKKEE